MNNRSDPAWCAQELITRFHRRTKWIGETAEDIVLEVMGAGKGSRGKPTRRQVRHAAILLVLWLQKSSDSEVRSLIARMLGELKSAQWTVAPLIMALTDQDSRVRASAALALGNLGNKRAVKPLIHLLLSEEGTARMQAAREADRIRWNNFDFASQVRKEQQVRLNALEALGSLGDPRALKPLISLLSNKKVNSRIATTPARHDFQESLKSDEEIVDYSWEESKEREKIVWVLGELHDIRALDTLCGLLSEREGKIGFYAALALRKLSDKRSIRPLIGTFASWDHEIRFVVTQALLDFEREDVIEPLIEAFSSGSTLMRRQLAHALAELKVTQAVEPLIAVLADEDKEMRADAVQALGVIGDTRAREPIFHLFCHDTEYVRAAALVALARLRDGRVFDTLMDTLIRRETPPGRHGLPIAMEKATAIRGLMDLGDQRAVEPLLALLEKEDSYVCSTIIEALAKFGDLRAVEPLIRLLTAENGSHSHEVRRSAIQALGDLSDPRAVEPLIATFKQEAARITSQDEYAPLPRYAVQALVGLGDRRAVEPFISYLKGHKSIQWQLASYVIEALGTFGDLSALPAIQWTLRYNGNKILELDPPARAQYRLYSIKEKATEAIARIVNGHQHNHSIGGE